MKMISVVLPHFNEIILSEFIENNFLFKIKKSQNVAFVVTKEGGHVGFFQNWNTKITYSEEVTLDFIETVTKIKNSANKH